MQRHHLLPCQAVSSTCFGRLFESLGRSRIGFDDFRANGLLLPADDSRARLLGLPLHRGPHRDYNAMVIERIGQIEAHWARSRRRAGVAASDEALFRLALLQRALRRRLLAPRGRALQLNRRMAPPPENAFAELDAMAELLWSDSAVINEPVQTVSG